MESRMEHGTAPGIVMPTAFYGAQALMPGGNQVGGFDFNLPKSPPVSGMVTEVLNNAEISHSTSFAKFTLFINFIGLAFALTMRTFGLTRYLGFNLQDFYTYYFNCFFTSHSGLDAVDTMAFVLALWDLVWLWRLLPRSKGTMATNVYGFGYSWFSSGAIFMCDGLAVTFSEKSWPIPGACLYALACAIAAWTYYNIVTGRKKGINPDDNTVTGTDMISWKTVFTVDITHTYLLSFAHINCWKYIVAWAISVDRRDLLMLNGQEIIGPLVIALLFVAPSIFINYWIFLDPFSALCNAFVLFCIGFTQIVPYTGQITYQITAIVAISGFGVLLVFGLIGLDNMRLLSAKTWDSYALKNK